jgi:predicted XRE-type DNA-binding protein
MATHTLAEKLKIGREIKQALDAMIPEHARLSDAQIAQEMGISQQYVTRIELLALYKISQKLKEKRAAEAAEEAHGMRGAVGTQWHKCGGRWCQLKK